MEGAGDDGGRGGAADVRLRSHGHEEQRCADQLVDEQHQAAVHGDPDHAQQEQEGLVEQGFQVHVHADGRHQHVQHGRADGRGARAFQAARPGKAQQQAEGGGEHDDPEEVRRQAVILQAPCGRQGGDPADDGAGQEVRQARHAQAHAEDDHDVGQGGDARMLRTVTFDAVLERVDGGQIRAGPAVEGARAAGQEQQHGRPDVGHQHIDGDELAKQGGVHFKHFLHGRLVGAAAYPRAGHGGHAAPGVARHRFRVDQTQGFERDKGAQHDAKRASEKHDDGFGPQADDAAEIDGHAQQDQRAGQQIVARHGVQAGRVAIDDAEGVEQRRDQVAHQQRRDIRVKLFPEAGPQGHGEQAEDDGVIGDQGRCGRWHRGFR